MTSFPLKKKSNNIYPQLRQPARLDFSLIVKINTWFSLLWSEKLKFEYQALII